MKCVSTSVLCLCWKARQESSPYINRSEGPACFISLTYIRKIKGPKIDPWEIPHKIFEMLEYLFSMLTKNSQFTVSSQKPIAFNFVTVYYGRCYQRPLEDLSVSYQWREHYQSLSNVCHSSMEDTNLSNVLF